MEPYHCKGRFLEDFEALCREAQISHLVPVAIRPHLSGTPMVGSSVTDIKDKTTPKTAKGGPSKERESLASQQQNETDSGDIPHG